MENGEIGAGKDDETAGLGRLGGNLHGRNEDKEPPEASRPDTTYREAIPLSVCPTVGRSCRPMLTTAKPYRGAERLS